MARYYAMTWQASTRRWFREHKGRMYTVSCRQLGTPDTMEDGAAANAWCRPGLRSNSATMRGPFAR